MAQDFDFVSIKDYISDTQELVENAVSVINGLKSERDRVKDFLFAIVAKYGEIRVHEIRPHENVEIEYFRDCATDEYVYRAIKPKEAPHDAGQ